MLIKFRPRLVLSLILLLGVVASVSGQPLDIDPTYPRWFKYGKDYLALSGNGLWTPISQTEYDLAEHNAHARKWGANSNRVALTAFCHIGLCPWERPGPGQANDGKPRFNLDQFNDAYWKRAVAYFEDAKKQGIFPLIQVWDECSCESAPSGEERWNKNPFNPDNNINDLPDLPRGVADGDRDNAFYNVKNEKLMRYQDRFVREALDRLGRLPVIWDVGNEVGLDSRIGDDWIRHWADFFKAYEKEHPGVRILSTIDCNLNNGYYDRINNFDVINVHGAHGPHATMPFHLKGQPDKNPGDSRVNVKKLQADLEYWYNRYKKPLVNSRITSDPDRKRGIDDRPGNALETRHILWGHFLSAAHFISFRNDAENSWAPQALTTERQQAQLRKFIDGFEFWKCTPRLEDIVKTPDAVVLAEAGRQYTFYAPNGPHFGNSFTADLSGAEGKTFQARWFDPRAGEFGEPFKVQPGKEVKFTLPSDEDWALLLVGQ